MLHCWTAALDLHCCARRPKLLVLEPELSEVWNAEHSNADLQVKSETSNTQFNLDSKFYQCLLSMSTQYRQPRAHGSPPFLTVCPYPLVASPSLSQTLLATSGTEKASVGTIALLSTLDWTSSACSVASSPPPRKRMRIPFLSHSSYAPRLLFSVTSLSVVEHHLCRHVQRAP